MLQNAKTFRFQIFSEHITFAKTLIVRMTLIGAREVTKLHREMGSTF